VRTTPSTETDDRRATLEAFAPPLRREMHVLQNRPELTWQQLYNRLQWEGDAVAERLTDERQRRSRRGARPWIHRYSPLRESEALVRSLAGHTDQVHGCAVSPDGAWIVSASGDGTLKIWDAATGSERATLTGHTGNVHACAVSPDGTWIVSASWDGALKIWDAASGRERATLTGHAKLVDGSAVSPDHTWIVSASLDEREKWRRSGGPGTAASTWQCGNARLARWLRASLAIGARTPPSLRSPHPAPLT
jgi:WD40 repeat protein